MYLDKYKKILFVHKGAFGDFLQTWPAIYSLIEMFKNEKDFFWAGKEEYKSFLKPLGIKFLSWKYKILLDNVYSYRELPPELQDYFIIWFVLQKKITDRKYNNILFLQGIKNEGSDFVWKEYLKGLNEIQINTSISMKWIEKWRSFFVGQNSKPHKIIIFPGSGHILKNWPLERYIEVGRCLAFRGQEVAFVLGPAELDRNLNMQDHKGLFQILISKDFNYLQKIMVEAKMVIGNDSGPLHLAGFNGIPSVVIFGPTNPRLWAPIGSYVISPDISCAPCTSLIDIKCNNLSCLSSISPSKVLDVVFDILNTR